MNRQDRTMSRRNMLLGGGLATAAGLVALSGAGTLLLRGEALAAASGDVDTLNVALGLEHEGIAAYELGAQSKLLKPAVLKVAAKFMDDHKVHRDLLAAAIKKMGGEPVQPKTMAEYAKSLNAAALKTQKDVLELALRLELGATNAYLGVIPAFQDRDLAKVSGRLAAEEALHWTTLNAALGKPLPKAMFFGS